jgi:hypothetical protein
VKIHFVHSEKFYLARNRPPRILAAYNLPSAKHNEARPG